MKSFLTRRRSSSASKAADFVGERLQLVLTSLAHVAVVGVALAATTGCEPGGIGDPCIPEDEYRSGFSGYSKDEVNVESRSFQCETRVCLVNKFQGRVSCKYGQDMPNGGCRTPDESNPIEVPINDTHRQRPAQMEISSLPSLAVSLRFSP